MSSFTLAGAAQLSQARRKGQVAHGQALKAKRWGWHEMRGTWGQ